MHDAPRVSVPLMSRDSHLNASFIQRAINAFICRACKKIQWTLSASFEARSLLWFAPWETHSNFNPFHSKSSRNTTKWPFSYIKTKINMNLCSNWQSSGNLPAESCANYRGYNAGPSLGGGGGTMVLCHGPRAPIRGHALNTTATKCSKCTSLQATCLYKHWQRSREQIH